MLASFKTTLFGAGTACEERPRTVKILVVLYLALNFFRAPVEFLEVPPAGKDNNFTNADRKSVV